MWKICDVQPLLLLPAVLDLRLLFRKLFMVMPYLLSHSQAKLSAPIGTCPRSPHREVRSEEKVRKFNRGKETIRDS